ncbi:MAG: filamentous hemagglutinin N-terminal domain-containing protein [Phormidium tanganyikae FI6-MK23]|nr:filamentous hemagglutinin N-terminal domain-containing protein [Phormidium tanganyikae FI6-MK23]
MAGGTAESRNLFHSFDRFSLNSGQTAVFAPDSSIANIITRVTGNEIAKIDGTIAVNGNANLFLVNPNGITFGQSASLAINGSLNLLSC